MKPFAHTFQRLPSDHELDQYQNTYSHQLPPTHHPPPPHGFQTLPISTAPASDYSFQGSSPSHKLHNYNNDHHVPDFQYEPVGNFSTHQSVKSAVFRPSRTLEILGFISHLILTVVPVAFIVLAFLALSVNGEPLSGRGTAVYQAAKLGPSIFPVVFAAVVGRLMKTLALWRAERGSTIGLLEQLSGSQNLLAAIERWLFVSSLGGWSTLIVVLWALSPLGGQSSLRVLELSQSGDVSIQQLKYFDTDKWNTTMFIGASAITSGLPAVQAIFQACLLAPASISSSSADIWGNVKIPLMQSLNSYTGLSTQDWINVNHSSDTKYSSLSGIVVSGLRSDVTTTFTIETSYLNLTCPPPVVFGNGDPKANISLILASFQKWLGNVVIHRNASLSPFEAPYGSNNGWASFMVDSNLNLSVPGTRNTRPVNFIYAAKNMDILKVTAYNCSVGLSHVEASIACNGTSCRVEQMRPSRQNTDASVSTPWNQDNSAVPFYNFMSTFPWMSGTVHAGDTTPADFYVSGNNTPFQRSGRRSPDYTNVTGLQVAQRLGALINTAWHSSIAQTSIALPPPDLSVFSTTAAPFAAKNVTASMQTMQIVYHANKLWIGLTAAISVLLFICGVAGMLLHYITTAPDILGYVSTMTRDNPFFTDHRASGADSLDGLDRARLLRDAVVQIADVKPWQGGHIALKSVAAGEDRTSNRMQRKGRWRQPSQNLPLI